MLIRFEVSNYRSIKDAVELSMVAVDRERPEAREAPLLGVSLLTVAAVLGPNASGKSNIIGAFGWLRDAVQSSLRDWDEEIPVEPFAFQDGPKRPTEFVVEALVDGVRFEYVVELTRDAVLYEGLFHYPEKKRKRIFERDEAGELKLQRGLGSLSGTRKMLTEKTLALSVMRRFHEPLVSNFARDLLRTQSLGATIRRPRAGGVGGGFMRGPLGIAGSARRTLRWFEEPRSEIEPMLFEQMSRSEVQERVSLEDRQQALALLKLADLGIEDVVIDEETISYPDMPDASARTRRRVRLMHKTGTGQEPLDFSAESEGTRTWFTLIGPVLSALRTGALLLFDELDASLHPTLSAQIINLFHDPVTNPHGAQLVFTTHDTSLLNHLNRDEVWLTEKNSEGATRMGALAEFAGERVRKSQNLEAAYLHGRFGGLPNVDQADVLRSLGLIG